MKRLLAGAALSALLAQGAMAQTVAVSMARFDDNFLTVIRNGMEAYAKTLDGVDLQIEDARTTSPSSSTRSTTSSPPAWTRSSSTRSTPRRPRRCRTRPRPAAADGLRQPRADQRRHAARQPGLRRLGRARVGHARDQGDLPPVQGGRQDRGQRLRDHGRAVEPGGAAAHPGHPRRDRLRRVRGEGQHHRQADLELDARPRRRT